MKEQPVKLFKLLRRKGQTYWGLVHNFGVLVIFCLSFTSDENFTDLGVCLMFLEIPSIKFQQCQRIFNLFSFGGGQFFSELVEPFMLRNQ